MIDSKLIIVLILLSIMDHRPKSNWWRGLHSWMDWETEWRERSVCTYMKRVC